MRNPGEGVHQMAETVTENSGWRARGTNAIPMGDYNFNNFKTVRARTLRF